jgi:glutamate carboxypeptidase
LSEAEIYYYANSSLPQLFTDHNQESLKFLEKIVAIDSQTKNISGVNLVQAQFAEKLLAMGFECQFILPSNSDKSGNLLIAEKKGRTSETITFIGHADTVFSPTPEFGFEINYAENEITGPGIGDDKGGVVMALSALERFLSSNDDHYYTILFVSSPNEETGSIGFHDVFKKMGERSKIILGLEPALYNGALISSRNGNRWYDIEIRGRSAHAGRFDEPFVNAAHHAAEFISKAHELNDIPNKIKVNIGSIKSGVDRYNVVCDKVEIKLDARFPTYESRDFLHSSLESYLKNTNIECFYTKEKCTFNYQIVDDCPPLPLIKNEDPLTELYLQEIEAIEKKYYCHEHSGGAADINYFYRPGLIYLDGLGPITIGMHTRNEVMKLDSFFTRGQALENILTRLNQN